MIATLEKNIEAMLQRDSGNVYHAVVGIFSILCTHSQVHWNDMINSHLGRTYVSFMD